MTAYRVGETYQAILYPRVLVAICIPSVAQLFTNSSCLKTLQATEKG